MSASKDCGSESGVDPVSNQADLGRNSSEDGGFESENIGNVKIGNVSVDFEKGSLSVLDG